MWFSKKIVDLILAVLVLPFVLLIRILSPFLIIRICVFDLSRIGHILPYFEMYICRRNAGLKDARHFDICCFSKGKVANEQIKKMVGRTISIYPFAFWVDKVNKRIPGWKKHVVPARSRSDDLAGKISPNITFTEKEHEQGREELQRLGMAPNNPFICFHARDAAYLNVHQPQVNWDYHSYRNADIDHYVPAAETLAGKGYFAVRMGRFVTKKVKTNNPRIIDYAANGGTDFLDVYLSAHCRFFIAGSDGLALVPTLFRRPVVWVDFIPFSAIYVPIKGQLVILKKLWSLRENRMLTFDEMLNTEVAQYYKTENYERVGIKVINNSLEEIMDVSMEMEDRLSGVWKETEEDKELQQRFQRIVGRKDGSKFSGSIGARFLRQYKELLDMGNA